ncbi:MAG: hypothetical protein WC455_15145 [Dehalococcoidia bacterium]|jgi:hypothetical protein
MTSEQWIVSNDTGSSSITIWAVMMGVTPPDPSIPYDPSDFGRCHRLFTTIPEWRGRLHEVAEAYPEWRSLVENWDKMTAIYLRDLPSGRSSELYTFMQELRNGRTQ